MSPACPLSSGPSSLSRPWGIAFACSVSSNSLWRVHAYDDSGERPSPMMIASRPRLSSCHSPARACCSDGTRYLRETRSMHEWYWPVTSLFEKRERRECCDTESLPYSLSRTHAIFRLSGRSLRKSLPQNRRRRCGQRPQRQSKRPMTSSYVDGRRKWIPSSST